MVNRNETWVSAELETALAGLTAQQAAGVLRIVQAELAGKGVSTLLDCEGQICTSTTFYNRKRGWVHKPGFQQALALARRDYRSWALEWGGRDALAILAQTAPDGARVLRQQIVGDSQAIEALIRLLRNSQDVTERGAAAAALGRTGLLAVAPALISALENEQVAEVRSTIIAGLAEIAGSRDGDRRTAVGAVLSRVGLEEAARLRVNETEVDRAIEEEIEKLRREATNDRE